MRCIEMNKNYNSSIKCSVEQCRNHCDTENYCSLNEVKIGTHEQNPTMKQCVDCESFELK